MGTIAVGISIVGDPADFITEFANALRFTEVRRKGEMEALEQMRIRAPRRTGKLRDSINIRKVHPLRSVIGTDLVYGDVQNKGGRIRSRRGWMALPVHQGLPPVRQYPGKLFVLKAKNNTLVLCDRVQGKVRVRYVLRKSVRIKAQPWVTDSRPPVADVIDKAAVQIISQAKAKAARLSQAKREIIAKERARVETAGKEWRGEERFTRGKLRAAGGRMRRTQRERLRVQRQTERAEKRAHREALAVQRQAQKMFREQQRAARQRMREVRRLQKEANQLAVKARKAEAAARKADRAAQKAARVAAKLQRAAERAKRASERAERQRLKNRRESA